MKIQRGVYKNLESIIVENELLRVEIVPSSGARTASIVYKPLNEELLWQNPADKHSPVRYGQPYNDGEFAGFDEMFPTINECFYPDYPWRGIEIPDHGEVWALPWQYNLESNSVTFSVDGIRLPYRLSKQIRIEGSELKAVYRVDNKSMFKLPFLYAAHPLFKVDAGDKIIVPENLHSVINSVTSASLSEYGREYKWPVDENQEYDLSVMPPESSNGYKKYYFSNKNTEGWSMLERKKLGLRIKISCTADKIPWLGIWANEGGWEQQYNIALEPATAAMDSITSARIWGKESVLEPFESRTWELDLGIIRV